MTGKIGICMHAIMNASKEVKHEKDNIVLLQWVLTTGDLCAPGAICQCLETFLIATIGGKCYWHLVGTD